MPPPGEAPRWWEREEDLFKVRISCTMKALPGEKESVIRIVATAEQIRQLNEADASRERGTIRI